MDSNTTILPLKYKALSSISRNLDNNDLRKVASHFKEERIKRGRPVKIVLSPRPLEDLMQFPWLFRQEILYESLLYEVYFQYVTQKCPNLNKVDAQTVATALVNVLKIGNPYEEEADEESDWIPECISEKDLHELLLSINTKDFDEEFEMTPENKYLIRAVEKLERLGIAPAGYSVYEFILPLGFSYVLVRDEEKGTIPKLVDDW